MIGSVSEYQEEVRQAELAKRRTAIPQPCDEQVRWARDVLADGYQATVEDRTDAAAIAQRAGLDPAALNPDVTPDSAPAGTRELAAALERQADAYDGDADVAKTYGDRGITCGPGEPMEPSAPREPGTFARGYIDRDHAAPSPQAETPTVNPRPAWPAGVPVPVQLGDMPVVGRVPDAIARNLALGSPSER